MTAHEKIALQKKVEKAYNAVSIAYDYMRRHFSEEIIESNVDSLAQLSCAMASLESFIENEIVCEYDYKN